MTALTQMAAVRPPGIADARVPCPLCGGLIHPVAGRCKHCKEDLSAYRSARPQAAASLPALNGAAAPNGGAGTNGHAVATAAPLPVATREASQPILPPRTTARSVPAQQPHSVWRSWPMLVIVLAVIAIVAATVIMIMPPDEHKGSGKMSAPPAPERMETNPLPENTQGQLDPWDSPQGHVPSAPDPQPARPQPQPAPPSAPDPDDDLWGGSGGGVIGGTLGGSLGTAGTDFMITVFDHACTKLKSCPDVDQSSLTTICDGVAMMPKNPLPSNCAAAQRCLDAIDHLDCTNAQSTTPLSVLTMFNDCTEAVNRC